MTNAPMSSAPDRTGNARAAAAAAVLQQARAHRVAADDHEVAILQQALQWALLHEVTDDLVAAEWPLNDAAFTGVPIGGEGTPLVAEACVAEFAAVLGLRTTAGKELLGNVLDLEFRLPRLWERTQAGQVTAWRARRVAQATNHLSLAAADYVDQQVHRVAHSVGPTALERLVEEAIAAYMPELALQEAEEAAEHRFFEIHHQQVSIRGTAFVCGELEVADALALEKAISAGAQYLRQQGATAPLAVLRAQAVGELARGDFWIGREHSPSPASAGPVADVARRTTPSSKIVIYAHLPAAAITDPSLSGSAARVENSGVAPVTVAQVAAWCGAELAQVVVRPVVDLAETITGSGYSIPPQLRRQVILRDGTCVFPWCSKPARSCDLDHIVPWRLGGATNTHNLAALCRHHHRLKTLSEWSYQRAGPRAYRWLSPHGWSYLVDASGTTLVGRGDAPPGQPRRAQGG